ncbi:oxalate decarboxylase [Punctularia strigosozonata HHB-11173 SS5]|uniref:Oxalate decarboxylase n=1 Tax=Punctularia strigosozonata (strain HHB-11173) TaxID=741275 RepID=R7S278_PUNST|nr:oxalate decarboxylase [Punctularia strigosozonata HHB-11173 SS5]EIN03969.1 oxalate decarboxylase [Punctularia strigosozonata HHB-11173 SS5]
MLRLPRTFLTLLAFATIAVAAPAVSQVASSVPSSPATSTAANLSLSAPAVGSSSAVSTADVSASDGASTTSAVPAVTQTVAPASDNPNTIMWTPDDPPSGADATEPYQPIRGSLGSNIIGPQNVPMQQQNADLLAPPTTDHGTVANFKWPFSLSHNRIQTGGWARQQNTDVLPAATEMAAVNMRLEKGAIRELHWHKTSEWAYVLKGSTQITAVNAQGQNYMATVNAGDLWYFPPGIPHSLQATGDDDEGTEFLLVFDDGEFSEDSTFLLTDWLAHVPKETIAKNFKTDIAAWNNLPGDQLYIFPSSPLPEGAKDVVSPQGTVPEPFSFPLSQVNATQLAGGSVKVVDSTNFKVSTTIAMAEVTVEPGAMRELHWHPTADEWGEGESRVTVFASSSNARTFNYQAGDISYVPASFGHYVENVGNTTLRFLEIFNSDRFEDVSLNQWLALTPPELVKAHLGIDDATVAKLTKTKATVIGPSNPS